MLQKYKSWIVLACWIVLILTVLATFFGPVGVIRLQKYLVLVLALSTAIISLKLDNRN